MKFLTKKILILIVGILFTYSTVTFAAVSDEKNQNVEGVYPQNNLYNMHQMLLMLTTYGKHGIKLENKQHAMMAILKTMESNLWLYTKKDVNHQNQIFLSGYKTFIQSSTVNPPDYSYFKNEKGLTQEYQLTTSAGNKSAPQFGPILEMGSQSCMTLFYQNQTATKSLEAVIKCYNYEDFRLKFFLMLTGISCDKLDDPCIKKLEEQAATGTGQVPANLAAFVQEIFANPTYSFSVVSENDGFLVENYDVPEIELFRLKRNGVEEWGIPVVFTAKKGAASTLNIAYITNSSLAESKKALVNPANNLDLIIPFTSLIAWNDKPLNSSEYSHPVFLPYGGHILFLFKDGQNRLQAGVQTLDGRTSAALTNLNRSIRKVTPTVIPHMKSPSAAPAQSLGLNFEYQFLFELEGINGGQTQVSIFNMVANPQSELLQKPVIQHCSTAYLLTEATTSRLNPTAVVRMTETGNQVHLVYEKTNSSQVNRLYYAMNQFQCATDSVAPVTALSVNAPIIAETPITCAQNATQPRFTVLKSTANHELATSSTTQGITTAFLPPLDIIYLANGNSVQHISDVGTAASCGNLCFETSECNDNDNCTTDACVQNQCVNTFIDNPALCLGSESLPPGPTTGDDTGTDTSTDDGGDTGVEPDPCGSDSDNDGIGDLCDRCLGHPDSADSDFDLIPDGCDQVQNQDPVVTPQICESSGGIVQSPSISTILDAVQNPDKYDVIVTGNEVTGLCLNGGFSFGGGGVSCNLTSTDSKNSATKNLFALLILALSFTSFILCAKTRRAKLKE